MQQLKYNVLALPGSHVQERIHAKVSCQWLSTCMQFSYRIYSIQGVVIYAVLSVLTHTNLHELWAQLTMPSYAEHRKKKKTIQLTNLFNALALCKNTCQFFRVDFCSRHTQCLSRTVRNCTLHISFYQKEAFAIFFYFREHIENITLNLNPACLRK